MRVRRQWRVLPFLPPREASENRRLALDFVSWNSSHTMHEEFPRDDEENEAADLECDLVRHGF